MPKKFKLKDRDGRPVQRTLITAEEIAALPTPTLGMTFNDLYERDFPGYIPPPNFPNLDKPAFEVMAHAAWQPGESLVHDVVIVHYKAPDFERALNSLVERVEFSRTAFFHHERWEYLRTFYKYRVERAVDQAEDLDLIFDEDLEKSIFKDISRAALFLAICGDLKPSTKLSEIPIYFALRPMIRKYIETDIIPDGMTSDRAIREDGKIFLSFDDDIEDDDHIEEEDLGKLGKKEKRIAEVEYSIAQAQAIETAERSMVIRESAKVTKVAERLTEEERELWDARLWGIGYDVIGTYFGITPAAARKRLQRIREKMNDWLSEG